MSEVEQGIEDTLINAVPQPLAVLHALRDSKGTIVDFVWDHINDAGAAEIHVDRDTLIGQRLLELLPEQRNGLFQAYSRVVETGEPFEVREAGYDDTWGTQEVIPRIYDIRAIKHLDGFAFWWNDVTDRVKERVELERLAQQGEISDRIIERAPVGMALVSAQGEFTWLSPAFCRIAGYDHDELLTKTFQEITHPEDLDRDLELVQQVADRQIDSYVMDKRYFRADGSIVWVRLHASGLWRDDGTFVTFIAQIADLSDEKALIEQLEVTNKELQHWSYVASHDLQAPMRVVGTYTDLLAEALGTDIAEEPLEYMHEIRASVEIMRTMVADLLSFSRAARTDYTPAPLQLRALIDAALAENGTRIDATGARVVNEVAEDLLVTGNAEHLGSVFAELLTNAIKYRAADRTPQVTVSAVSQGDTVRISVIDNGSGIPAELSDRAFTMFQRLRTDQPGTGVGLALVRRIVQQHNGAVWLDSDGRSGTAVNLRLPAPKSETFSGQDI